MLKKGIPASPGVVFGKVCILETNKNVKNVRKQIPKHEIDKEVERFFNALNATKEELKNVHKNVLMEIGQKHASLFYAYILILEDAIFKEDIVSNIRQGMSVEYALQKVLANIEKTFNNIEDLYLKEREQDIKDVVQKIINNLSVKTNEKRCYIEGNSVIVAHGLTPTDTMSMKNRNIKAFLTNIGGRTSHTAIFAQALQIPAIVGLHNITEELNDGDFVIVDGYKGIVIINPSEEEIAEYTIEKQRLEEIERQLEKIKDVPAITKDKFKINLQANIEIPEEIDTVLMHGATGIGLYRTEFLYVNNTEFPSEDYQYEKYKFVAERIMPYSVTIRTMDFGGDKFVDRIEKIENVKEKNPFLGLRGIRFSLKYKDIFATQIRAILRASVHGKIKIMYPMISSHEEFLEANEVVKKVKKELDLQNIPYDKNIKIGAMLEVPSVAFCADLLADFADFFSIGTNDLIQYSFAVDRANENVSNLYKPYHIAIIRMLKMIVENVKDKEISVCGEMGSDMKLIKVLIGLGFKNISMSSTFIPKIKEIIINTKLSECEELVNKLLQAKTEKEIIELLGI